jgi:hypothetical protein
MTTPESNLPATVSIIDSIQIQQVQSTMQKIAQFQAVVQSTLKVKHDYGVIPGTEKPTLLKPGAEKILMLMGLTSEYDVTEKVQDYDAGFFAFTVKCTIYRGTMKITEGLGHANTKESRYTNRWVTAKKVPPGIDQSTLKTRQKESRFKPGETYTEYLVENSDGYTLANTVLKMAKKRAQVDAALTVASLSEIFTQDLEDLPEIPTERPANQGAERPLTDGQIRRLYAIANKHGITAEMMKAWADTYLDGKNPKELTKTEYDELCAGMENGTIQAWYDTQPVDAEWEAMQGDSVNS